MALVKGNTRRNFIFKNSVFNLDQFLKV